MIKSVRCFFLRLRESEINFVFCEWVLFYPLATKQYAVLFLPNSHVNLEPRVSCALHNSLPRAKDGKRQKGQGLDVLDLFFNLSECNKLHPPLFAREAKRFIHFIRCGLTALSIVLVTSFWEATCLHLHFLR